MFVALGVRPVCARTFVTDGVRRGLPVTRRGGVISGPVLVAGQLMLIALGIGPARSSRAVVFAR